jgi:hypothetical protein
MRLIRDLTQHFFIISENGYHINISIVKMVFQNILWEIFCLLTLICLEKKLKIQSFLSRMCHVMNMLSLDSIVVINAGLFRSARLSDLSS